MATKPYNGYVALVGLCWMDGPWLAEEFAARLPKGCDAVKRPETPKALLDHARKGAVIVVNRNLDDDFEDHFASGIEVVKMLLRKIPTAKVVLVSNYEDSQREAAALGALPGFGKRDVGKAAFDSWVQTHCCPTKRNR